MGERSGVFQGAVILLLVVLAALGLLIVIQNNDTQHKLEELRAQLQRQRAERADASLAAGAPSTSTLTPGTSAVPAPTAPASPALLAASTPEAAAVAAARPGPDGVLEYRLGGLRVRAREYQNPAAVDGDSLTRSFGADAKVLNPYVFNEALGSSVFGMCNDGLAARDFDDPERWVPHLATGWQIEQTIRVHLLPAAGADPAAGPRAPACVAAWRAEADCAAQWRQADIVAIEPDGDDVIVVKTDSVRNGFMAYLEHRLKNRTQPVQYLTVTLEPKFKPPAGTTLADLKTELRKKVAAALAAQVPAKPPVVWQELGARDLSDTELGCVGLGDGEAYAALWTQVLKQASPQWNDADPATQCGHVNPPETQPFEIAPTVTFTLRHGVRWQSIEDPRQGQDHGVIPGPEFTADDLVFTYQKVLRNPKVPCEYLRNYYEDLLDVTAPDPYTVRFAWARPYFQVFDFSAGFTILPKHIFEQVDLDNLAASPFCRVVCGTGPWQFKRWTPNVELELDRNPDYWGVKPHLEHYRIKIVSPAVVLSQFQDGLLDQATLSPDEWKNNADTPAMQKISRKENGIANSYYYVGYNARKPQFQDPRVRLALTMLIDRQAIIQTIFNGNAVPITGPFHPLSPDNDASSPPVPFDPAGAVKLLNAAGWRDTDGDGVLDKDGVPFEYDLMYRSSRPEHEQIAAIVQQADRKAGIKCNLVVLEWSAFLDRIDKQEFSACILGWQLGYTQDPYQLWHSSQTGPAMHNFVGYKDPVSDRLIVEGRYTLDPELRHQLYHELHKRIYDAQPYSFLFVPKRMIVYSKRYEDVKYTLLDTDYDRYWVRPENQRQAP